MEAEHSFADHHPFSLQEIASLKESAKAKGALLVTTQKDLVRCSDPSGIHALMIRHVWDEPELFTQWLIKRVSDWRAEQD